MFNEFESLQYNNKEIKFYTPTKKTAGRVNKIFRKEPITITWMNNIKQDEIVIDVGANVGMDSLMSAVGRGAFVYGFEPEASNYNLLVQNIKLNSMSKKIQTYCAGVLDYDGFSSLNIAEDRDVGPGGSCHTVEEEVNFDLTPMNVIFKQGINVIKLDTFCEKLKIKPDHIKIDVDGLEHRVINGAIESIKNSKTVIIELNTNLTEHNETINLMKNLGFKLNDTQVKDALRKSGTFLNVGEHLFYKE
jgi:FkbM family methyltransferase